MMAGRDDDSPTTDDEVDRDSAGTYFVSVEDFEWRPKPKDDGDAEANQP